MNKSIKKFLKQYAFVLIAATILLISFSVSAAIETTITL